MNQEKKEVNLVAEFIKMIIAGSLLWMILHYFGSPTWIISLCAFGMGLTWKE